MKKQTRRVQLLGKQADAGQCVVMVGNLNEGYQMIGPFKDFETAAQYDENTCGGGNWIVTLTDPEEG